MVQIYLQPLDINYAEKMSALTSNPAVKNALGMSDHQTSIAGTRDFIRFMQLGERQGVFLSRMVMNEQHELIGVVTLKNIDQELKRCHIGTWLAELYWGLGINFTAKTEMLYEAFMELDLELVFVGARLENIRSQKAQQKLPFISIHVENEFPEEWQTLERLEHTPCMLNVVRKSDFLQWYNSQLEAC